MGTRAAARRRGHDRRSGRARAFSQPRRADPARGRRGARRDARRRRARERDRAGRPRGRGSPSRRRGDERRGRQRRRAAARRPVSRRRDAQALARPGRPECRARVLLAQTRSSRPARPATRLDALTSRSTSGRSSGARSSSPSCAATRAARRRTPASRATGASGSRSCSRSRSASAQRGSRPGTTRESSRTAAGSCSRAQSTERRISRTCSAGSTPAFLDRIWFPLGEQTKAETRAEAEAAGLRGCGTRREPGGLLPRRRRLPLLPRAPRAERRGPDRGRGRARARQTRRRLALHARPAPRARRLVRGSALRAQDRRGDLDARRRAPGVARHDERLRPRSAVRRRRTGRGEAALPLARGRRASGPRGSWIPPRARPAGLRGRGRAGRRPVRGRRCGRVRPDHSAADA